MDRPGAGLVDELLAVGVVLLACPAAHVRGRPVLALLGHHPLGDDVRYVSSHPDLFSNAGVVRHRR